MTSDLPRFDIESLVANTGTENPLDLWLAYQSNIPASTPINVLSQMKAEFLNQVSDLLSGYQEIMDD